MHPDRSPPAQVLGHPAPALRGPFSRVPVLWGRAVREWHSPASQLQPATRQDAHPPTQHPALGPQRAGGGDGGGVGGGGTNEKRKKHLSPPAHPGGGPRGAGALASQLPYQRTPRRRLSAATGSIPSPKTRTSRFGDLSFQLKDKQANNNK